MIYTCSCCKHMEYRFGVGCNAYYCTVHCDYMHPMSPGSRQCKDFELEAQTTVNMFDTKKMQELVNAAVVIQQHCCESSECKACPFWKDFCVLRDNAPAGWDLSEVEVKTDVLD